MGTDKVDFATEPAAQYISPDPIGLEGGLAPQAYVHNPNGGVDPPSMR